MDNIEFETRFSNLKSKVRRNGPRYDDQIAENSSTERIDELFSDFADLYSDSSREQKSEIFDYFADKKIRFDFWIYIQRIAMLIESRDDGKWLQRGLAAALMDGGRGEWKELYITLPMLRYGAERVGIDVKAYFDEAFKFANQPIISVFKHALTEDEYRFTIQTSGPEEWANENIEKYGEHPLYSEMKKKTEEQDKRNTHLARLRKITISAILGVGAFIIIGLVIAYLLQPH
jgi:hypothetical protein